MHLIVALGNPGAKYTFTRHNVGWLCLEYSVEKMEEAGSTFTEKSEHKSITWKTKRAGNDIIFCEPQTFMNLSGQAVQSLMAFYKIPLENILVIQDDLDLAFGRIKYLKDRGPGSHNGLKNINELLGTTNYARLKIGVAGIRHPEQSGGDYVLGNFNEDELKKLNSSIFEHCYNSIISFVEKGYERTANVFNTKTDKETEEK